MDKINRRQVIKSGAAGTLALGALAVGASPASADEGRGGGIAINIHGVLNGVGGTPAGATLAINTDVAGRRGDLAGAGWDSGTNNTTAGGMVPTAGPTSPDPSGTAGPVRACYYTAAGSLVGDVVTLRGRSLFTNRDWTAPGVPPADSEDPNKADTRADGRELNATANIKTGAITWSLSPAGGTFAGTGTVVVFNGGRTENSD